MRGFYWAARRGGLFAVVWSSVVVDVIVDAVVDAVVDAAVFVIVLVACSIDTVNYWPLLARVGASLDLITLPLCNAVVRGTPFGG